MVAIEHLATRIRALEFRILWRTNHPHLDVRKTTPKREKSLWESMIRTGIGIGDCRTAVIALLSLQSIQLGVN
jgi:hypothetical protein